MTRLQVSVPTWTGARVNRHRLPAHLPFAFRLTSFFASRRPCTGGLTFSRIVFLHDLTVLNLAAPRSSLLAPAFNKLLEPFQVASDPPRHDAYRIAHVFGQSFEIVYEALSHAGTVRSIWFETH